MLSLFLNITWAFEIGRKIVSSFWFSRAADDFHTPATESDIKEKKNALGLFPECVFTGCTCDGHLFLFFLSSSSEIPARDSTSLSRQTKKHWLKIRNAECFPAFVWLCSPCTIQKNSSTESCRSNHTFERWTRAKTFLFDCVAVACSSGVFGRFFLLFPRCCCCVLTQTQLQDVIAFTITSQCDFKDFFPFFFCLCSFESFAQSDSHETCSFAKQWQKMRKLKSLFFSVSFAFNLTDFCALCFRCAFRYSNVIYFWLWGLQLCSQGLARGDM